MHSLFLRSETGFSPEFLKKKTNLKNSGDEIFWIYVPNWSRNISILENFLFSSIASRLRTSKQRFTMYLLKKIMDFKKNYIFGIYGQKWTRNTSNLEKTQFFSTAFQFRTLSYSSKIRSEHIIFPRILEKKKSEKFWRWDILNLRSKLVQKNLYPWKFFIFFDIISITNIKTAFYHVSFEENYEFFKKWYIRNLRPKMDQKHL